MMKVFCCCRVAEVTCDGFCIIVTITYQWYSLGFYSQRSKTGGVKTKKQKKIPDFGRFALGIWPKNTTKFSAAFGGQKGAKQGG